MRPRWRHRVLGGSVIGIVFGRGVRDLFLRNGSVRVLFADLRGVDGGGVGDPLWGPYRGGAGGPGAPGSAGL